MPHLVVPGGTGQGGESLSRAVGGAPRYVGVVAAPDVLGSQADHPPPGVPLVPFIAKGQ